MMTSKDFLAIAVTLDANRAPLTLVQDFADLLADQNPRFDRARFITASTMQIQTRMEYDLRKIQDGTA